MVEKDLHKQPYTNYGYFFHSLPLHYNFRATSFILRDNKGLMWFGTRDGLVKFEVLRRPNYMVGTPIDNMV